MTDSKLLDSSIWITFFSEKEPNLPSFADTHLYTSALSFLEVKKRLQKNKTPDTIINMCLAAMRSHSRVVPVSADIAELAATYNIPAIDAIIYASARTVDATLVTKDNDFRNLPNVHILN